MTSDTSHKIKECDELGHNMTEGRVDPWFENGAAIAILPYQESVVFRLNGNGEWIEADNMVVLEDYE